MDLMLLLICVDMYVYTTVGYISFKDISFPPIFRVVEFASYGDLKNAIEKLSGKEINGRKIKLIEGSKRHRYSFVNIFKPKTLCN